MPYHGHGIAELDFMRLSPVRRGFVILLVAAAIVIIGLMFAQDQETLRIRSAFAATDPANPEHLAALSGADPTRGNQYDVLTNGDQIFPAMLAAIDGARRRVSFETYIYDKGEAANQFTDALERAARRGVRVRLLTDSVGSSAMPAEHVDRLRKAGSEVIAYNPLRWYSLESVNYRTHRKILVVDGEIGFTGGVGVADHWLGHAQDKDHWRDTQVRLRGPIVRLLEAAFYDDYADSTGPVGPELDPAPARRNEQDASFLVRSSPTGGSSDLKRLYLLIVASAQKTLDITSPYFVTDESTRWSLEDAVRRGVTVRILVEGDITDAMPVKYASRAAYDRLLELGIQIFEYQPTMMHTKVLVADGIISMFGSANFDNRSLELNEELNVAVWSRDVAARFTQDFEEDLRKAQRLELGTWRERSVLEKSREHFWSYFGEIF
jgi:cardiolipin synthase A/B